MTPPTSRDHLGITDDICNLLFSSYNHHDEAIQEMEAEVCGYSLAHGGQWPFDDDEVLSSYVSLLEGAKQHAAGKRFCSHISRSRRTNNRKRGCQDRLMQLYNSALDTTTAN